VQHAVALSSVEPIKRTNGPVVGLHRMEQRLNRIAGSTSSPSPGYFMENTLIQAEMIPKLEHAIGPLSPELKIAMIAPAISGQRLPKHSCI